MAAVPTAAGGNPTPVVVVRQKIAGNPYYEAKWRDTNGRQIKRRIGRAWVEPDGTSGWRKRRGRVPEGWLDERMAHAAGAAKVAEVERELEAEARAAQRASVPTFRTVALEWLAWKRDVKGAAPSTQVNDEAILRDPGGRHRRGGGAAKGRIMAAFAEQEIDGVEARAISSFLRELDAESMTPAHVNEHRSVLHSIFNYAMKPDTYGLTVNPVSSTDKRAVPPPEALDFYEVEELEALARACERGEQRGRAPHYRGRPSAISDEEQEARRAEDYQDAELFRVKFYSGMRLGEVLALRWRHVTFMADLSGAVLDVQRAISAGVEKEPKGRRGRQVPLPRQGAAALARLGRRDDFTSPDDYVFCNRFGDHVDPSALRRRYKRAASAAGLRPIKLHGLRHSAGSILARTVPLVTVRDVLGHADLRTTNRYLHTKIDPAAIVAVNAAFGGDVAREAAPVAPAE
jgi:integrase